MPVFSLFCHGTGQHRSNGQANEIVHALSDKAGGTEYDDFLILDGPGKGVKSDKVNRMAGSFDAFDRNKGKKGDAPTWSRTGQRIMDVSSWEGGQSAPVWEPSRLGATAGGVGNLFTGGGSSKAVGVVATLLAPITATAGAIALSTDSMRGNVFGEGMDDNIRHAIAALGNKFSDFNGLTINMVGWSRGAITCIRAANWLQEFYGPGVNVNIFAVDPVAGGDLGEDVADTYIVPTVVKNLVAVLVMDDKRGGFKPQDINRLQPQDRRNTKMALLPIPGAHDTPVKLGKDPKFPEVAEVTRYMAYKFLSTMGTTFKTAETMYSAVQLSDKYAAMKSKLNGYAKKGKKGIAQAGMGGIIRRDVGNQLDRYISHHTGFFINEHHVECFKAAFPRVYQLFFTASPGTPPSRGGAQTISLAATTDIGRALQTMHQDSPHSSELFMELGVLNRRTTGILGTGPSFWTIKPAGLYTGDNGAMSNARGLLRTLVG